VRQLHGGAAAAAARQEEAAELRQSGGLEVWARGPPESPTAAQQQVASLLAPGVLGQLHQLCGRCLYRTLTSYVRMHAMGQFTVVLTGDIPAMWTRDSAVQMATYLPRLARRPALRSAVEGAIRAQAYFILQDPWANAYNPHYVPPASLPKAERQLGRGGWVWNRNWELDSAAYFINFMWNYHQTPAVWRPEALLREPQVHDAVTLMLKVLMIEQHHEQLSPYRCARVGCCGCGHRCCTLGGRHA
jgi:meiotically up-regulated gene 157 (Mug157) protein